MRAPTVLALLIALAVGLFAGRSLAEDAAPAKPKATPKFEKLQVVFLRRSDKAVDLTRAERRALNPRHLAHMDDLAKKGLLVLAGPIGEKDADSTLKGICIYRTDTREEAGKLAAEDPAVKAGALDAESVTWYVEEGYVAFPKAVTPKPEEPKKEPAPVR